MSNKQKSEDNALLPTEQNEEQDPIECLLRQMQPRLEPSTERAMRVKRHVYADWHSLIQKNRDQRQWRLVLPNPAWLLSAAAVAVLFLGLGTWHLTNQAIPVAQVVSMDGNGMLHDPHSKHMHPGQQLYSGQSIVTDALSRVSLRLLQGQSLRLDTNTHLRLIAAGKFHLERGAVYFDSVSNSQSLPQTRAIIIDTVFGDARDIGTQFEVRLTDNAMRLRVREGLVHVNSTDFFSHEYTITAGKELLLSSRHASQSASVAPSHADWQWIHIGSPLFELEGRRMSEFLEWFAREQGLTLHYVDIQTERFAGKNTLHGSVEGLSMDQALQVVALSSSVEYRIQEGILLIAKNDNMTMDIP